MSDAPVTRIVEFGKALQTRIKVFFDRPLDTKASPLELLHAVLDAVERRVQPLGRGRRVFPYSHITIRLVPVAADRTALQAVFDDVERRVEERLVELGVKPDAGVDVRVVHLKRAPDDWPAGQLFALDCRQDVVDAPPAAAPPPAAGPREVHVYVVKGTATSERYVFAQSVVSIGRTAEPTDAHGRTRRNDVVFVEAGDGVSETVGRAHARLQFDRAAGTYRLYNEAASNPTVVFRDGAAIQVAARDPRGVRIFAGDEIHLGRAVLRIEIP